MRVKVRAAGYCGGRLCPNRTKADKELPVGAIVTVEPGIYVEGKYGVRIEDMVYLAESGPVNLTNAKKELIELF